LPNQAAKQARAAMSAGRPDRDDRIVEIQAAHGRADGQREVTVTVLFTDIVGSTRLLDRLGDAASHALHRRHFDLLGRALRETGGRQVKTLGDGVMAVFAAPSAALACAAAMQRAVDAERVAGPRLEMRIGVHSGAAIHEDGDYFGRTVVVAKRLCDAAAAGQILTSQDSVSGAGADVGRRAIPVGALALAGLRLPVPAAAIEWRAAAAAA
jgi:class 3 adenylate cyclase